MRTILLAALILAATLSGCVGETPQENTGPMAEEMPPDDAPQVFRSPPEKPPEETGPVTNTTETVTETTTETPGPIAVAGKTNVFPTGHSAGEPNMGVTSSGALFASANNDILRSRDRGETWEVVHTSLLLNSDPMMWVDPWTDCIYNVPMSVILLASTIYESCDDGDTWPPIKSQNVGHGVYDHQKFATAPPGPDALPVAGVAHPTMMIICYNALVATNCAISYDGGLTWPIDEPIWDEVQGPSCAGQQSHPTGAPDGTLVVAKAWGCSDPLVFVSTDSGLTWEQRAGPEGIGADTLDPEIAFTDDGTMYMLWQSERGKSFAYLARSSDFGQSWDGPWNVTPPGVGSSIFASLAAGSPGRVAMAFHATNYTTDPSDAPADARWYTYVVRTEDADTDDPAGPTFVAYRVQPLDDPVQVGGICKGNRGCTDGNRNLLDFIDGAIAPDGTFYTVISDGCGQGCNDKENPQPADSRSREVHMVRLDEWSLLDEPRTGPLPIT